MFNFLNTYFLIFQQNSFNVHSFVHRQGLRKKKYFFNVFLMFKKRRLLLNLQDYNGNNFFFLAPGFFIKFFEKKKSLKNNKSLKILAAKYLRKLYLFIKIKYSIFHIKKAPAALLEFLSSLNSPIIHKFYDPFTNKLIEEKSSFKKPLVNASYFIFSKNIDFSDNKVQKKGRVKRKVTRKLILENSIPD